MGMIWNIRMAVFPFEKVSCKKKKKKPSLLLVQRWPLMWTPVFKRQHDLPAKCCSGAVQCCVAGGLVPLFVMHGTGSAHLHCWIRCLAFWWVTSLLPHTHINKLWISSAHAERVLLLTHSCLSAVKGGNKQKPLQRATSLCHHHWIYWDWVFFPLKLSVDMSIKQQRERI